MKKRDPKESDENCGRVQVRRQGSSSRKTALHDITNATGSADDAEGSTDNKRACLSPPAHTATTSSPPGLLPETGGNLKEESELRSKLLSCGYKICPAAVALLKLSDEARLSAPFGTSGQEDGVQVCSPYLVGGKAYTAGHRTQLVEFLLHYGHRLNLPPEASHMAAGFLDRALTSALATPASQAATAAAAVPDTPQPCAATYIVSISRLELAGAALQLARRKLRMPDADNLGWLLNLADKLDCRSLTEKTVALSVRTLEAVLQGKVDVPTARSYLHIFAQDYPEKSVLLAACLTDRCLQEHSLLKFHPAVTACAALYLAHSWYVEWVNFDRARSSSPSSRTVPPPLIAEVLGAACTCVPTLVGLVRVEDLQTCAAAVNLLLLHEQFHCTRVYCHRLLRALNRGLTFNDLVKVVQELPSQRPSSPEPFSFLNPGGSITKELQEYHELLPLLLLHMEAVLLKEEDRDGVVRPMPAAAHAGGLALTPFQAPSAVLRTGLPMNNNSAFQQVDQTQQSHQSARRKKRVAVRSKPAASVSKGPAVSEMETLPLLMDWGGLEDSSLLSVTEDSSLLHDPVFAPSSDGLVSRIPPLDDMTQAPGLADIDVSLLTLPDDTDLDLLSDVDANPLIMLDAFCGKNALFSPKATRAKGPGRPKKVPATIAPATQAAFFPADEHFLSMAQKVVFDQPVPRSPAKSPSDQFPSGASAASILQAVESTSTEWVSSACATPVKALSPRVRSKYQLVTSEDDEETETVLNSAIRHIENLSLSPTAVREMHGDVYRAVVICD